MSVGLMVHDVFIAVIIVVIDKARHSNFERWTFYGIVDGSECNFVKGVEKDTAVKVPDGRGGAPSLTGAKDRTVITMKVVSFGDPHLSFDALYGFLEHMVP
jgi:hypothetical protein